MTSWQKASHGLVLVGGFLLFLLSFAQTGIGITPSRYELVLKLGESFTGQFTVFTHDKGNVQITVGLRDWQISPDGSLFSLRPGSIPFSASSWLQVVTDPFTLNIQKPVKTKFTLSLPPQDDLNGSYWAALTFTTDPSIQVSKGVTTKFRTRVLAIIYVTIQGTEKPASELQGVSVETDQGGKRFVIADVVNKGNVYLRLNGELRFVNAKGEVVQRAPLPERVLLRDGLVRYRLQVPEDLPEDVVLAAIEIQPQGPAKSYGGPPLYGETSIP